MVWERGRESSKIPARVKAFVRARDKVCQLGYPDICTGSIDEIDHIVGIAELRVERKHANDASNLRGVCVPCHKRRTQEQSMAGRRKHLRPPPPPPGLAK